MSAHDKTSVGPNGDRSPSNEVGLPGPDTLRQAAPPNTTRRYHTRDHGRRLVAAHKAYLALVLDRTDVRWGEVHKPHGPWKAS